MQTIDFQKLMGGGGSPSYPPKDVIDLKIKLYSRQYWKREPEKASRMQRIAAVFVLVNYFEYRKTDCATIFQVDRTAIHRDLNHAKDIVLYPAIYRQISERFRKEIWRIYYYIK